MRYLALASDYDGTLATKGQVNQTTLDALQQWRDSGRRLILVTGRELDELLSIFPPIELFDCVVAENGALLYWPTTQTETLLGDRPSEAFVQALRDRHVHPLSVGRVIVATWRPHDTTVLQTIREQGLDLQIIFNKDAVMVLPGHLNKATGLQSALDHLQLSPHSTIGVGDAENDLDFLDLCGYSVAVANALPAVKARVHCCTQGSRGEGVTELIQQMLNVA